MGGLSRTTGAQDCSDAVGGTILQVIGDGSPGGGTTVVLSLALALREKGIAVAIATQARSYLTEETRKAGLRIIELDFRRRRDSLRLARELASHIRTLGPTLVHAHGARAGLPAALIPRSRRIALIYTVHGFHFTSKPVGLRQLARSIERFCIRRAAATVFVSAGDQRIALGAGLADPARPHEIIYNGSVAGIADRRQTNGKLYEIGFLGRLHFQKNPVLLPDILFALRPLRPRICVIGGGDLDAALRQRVSALGLDAQFDYMGERPHDEALSLLARARIMLLPSRWEGMPLSVIEAMHLGIPAVASNVTGTDELVVNGETGFLVESEDVAGYADSIGKLLQDEERYRRMSTAARERAGELFSLEQNVARHIALYARFTHASRGPLVPMA